MTFRLEALPAHKGDCLLLHYGTTAQPRLAIVDGGTPDVYFPSLKPRLNEIRTQRGVAPGAPLPIDLLMVSHIDEDHIFGVIELTTELTEAKDDHAPEPYKVREVWHNTFDDIIDTTPQDLQASVTARFGMAGSAESVLTNSPLLTLDAAKILASVGQGRQLRDNLRKLSLESNKRFGTDRLVLMEPGAKATKRLDMKGGLELLVVGPMKAQLLKLQKDHDQWLKKNKLAKTSPEAALAAFSDKSVPNLASIVVIAYSGPHSMLLTGDARGDFILDGLRHLKLASETTPLVVDVLKMPHHGSDNNVTTEFLRRIRATHYVFSGDGHHGNPERATLQMLFDARSGDADAKKQAFTVWFTYPRSEIDANRKVEWDKELKKGRKTRKWDQGKDSLAAFFVREEGKPPPSRLKFTVEDSKQPVDITL